MQCCLIVGSFSGGNPAGRVFVECPCARTYVGQMNSLQVSTTVADQSRSLIHEPRLTLYVTVYVTGVSGHTEAESRRYNTTMCVTSLHECRVLSRWQPRSSGGCNLFRCIVTPEDQSSNLLGNLGLQVSVDKLGNNLSIHI